MAKNDANSKWIESELNIANDAKEYDSKYLDAFKAPNDDLNHPYSETVRSALAQFKRWREDENGWKLSKAHKNGLRAYLKAVENESIFAVKGELSIPYSVPIVVGIILNDAHLTKYNKQYEKVEQLQTLSASNFICREIIKKPMPLISARDVILIRFVYMLENCEVIVGAKSIDFHPKDKGLSDKKYVRGFCTLHLWHIRPDYNSKNKHKHSMVTEYTHGKPNGLIPEKLINKMVGEQAQTVLNLKKYIDSIKNELHKSGVLHIPFPLVKSMKVF
jgi:hypothetical protein